MVETVQIPSTLKEAKPVKDRVMPEVIDDDFQRMIQDAPPWAKIGDNQKNIFEAQYQEAALMYTAEATAAPAEGRTILELFQKWKGFVDLFVRHVLAGEPDNPFGASLGIQNVEGQGSAVVRPLVEDSFTNATYAFTPGATGEFEWIPNTTDAATETPATSGGSGQQAWLILGYVERYAGNRVPYDYVQEDVSDGIGPRRQLYLANQMESRDTMKWAERRRGPLPVNPGVDMDLDLNIEEPNIQSGLWPAGIEVVRADVSNFNGVHD